MIPMATSVGTWKRRRGHQWGDGKKSWQLREYSIQMESANPELIPAMVSLTGASGLQTAEAGFGKLQPTDQIWPASFVHLACKLKMGVYIFKWLKRSKRTIFHDRWKLHEIQMSLTMKFHRKVAMLIFTHCPWLPSCHSGRTECLWQRLLVHKA